MNIEITEVNCTMCGGTGGIMLAEDDYATSTSFDQCLICGGTGRVAVEKVEHDAD